MSFQLEYDNNPQDIRTPSSSCSALTVINNNNNNPVGVHSLRITRVRTQLNPSHNQHRRLLDPCSRFMPNAIADAPNRQTKRSKLSGKRKFTVVHLTVGIASFRRSKPIQKWIRELVSGSASRLWQRHPMFLFQILWPDFRDSNKLAAASGKPHTQGF